MDEARGFFDKAKAAMSQAASKAKEEVDDLQARRDLGGAEKELGQIAFELLEAGELEHPSLDEAAGRVRELRARVAGDAGMDEPEANEPEPGESDDGERDDGELAPEVGAADAADVGSESPAEASEPDETRTG